MIMISSRKDFWDSNNLSSVEDQIKEVDLYNNSIKTKLTWDDFYKVIKDKKILLLIHGYNNSANDVCRAYWIIENKLNSIVVDQFYKSKYDLVIGYTWPGENFALNYQEAKKQASASSWKMKNWFEKLLSIENNVSLDIMTHSMGARLLLSTLQNISPEQSIRNIFSMAAAVDNESIEPKEKYGDCLNNCKNFYIFHSIYDKVLNVSYRIAEFDSALGYSGPEDPWIIINQVPKIKVVNCKDYVKEHGAYKNCDKIYEYIQVELTGGNHQQYYKL